MEPDQLNIEFQVVIFDPDAAASEQDEEFLTNLNIEPDADWRDSLDLYAPESATLDKRIAQMTLLDLKRVVAVGNRLAVAFHGAQSANRVLVIGLVVMTTMAVFAVAWGAFGWVGKCG